MEPIHLEHCTNIVEHCTITYWICSICSIWSNRLPIKSVRIDDYLLKYCLSRIISLVLNISYMRLCQSHLYQRFLGRKFARASLDVHDNIQCDTRPPRQFSSSVFFTKKFHYVVHQWVSSNLLETHCFNIFCQQILGKTCDKFSSLNDLYKSRINLQPSSCAILDVLCL